MTENVATDDDNTQNSEQVSAEVNKAAVDAFIEKIYAMDRDFEPPVMDRYGLGPWSISKLKVLRKCPLNFYLQYMLKVKVPDSVPGKQDSLSADIGSAAHLILEWIMRGKSTADAYKLARKEYGPDKISDEVWVEKLEGVEININAFKDRIDAIDRVHGIKRVFTEMRVAVNRDWEPTGFFSEDCFIRGVIDLPILLNNNDLLVFDHKYGGGQGSIRPYEDQLNSYKVLYNFGVDKINGAQSYIHYVAAGEIKPSYYSNNEDICGKLKDDLLWNIDGAIDAAEEIGYMKHICGSQCKWCPYSYVCKSKEKLLKPLELGTKKLFEIKVERAK